MASPFLAFMLYYFFHFLINATPPVAEWLCTQTGRKTPTEGSPPVSPGPKRGHLALKKLTSNRPAN